MEVADGIAQALSRAWSPGIIRLSDAALNLSPGLIFATEHGIPAAIIGMVSCLQD